MIFYLPVAHDLSILRPVILIWRTFHEICKQGHLGMAYKGGEPGNEGDGNSLREAGEEMAGSGISKATGTKRKGEN